MILKIYFVPGFRLDDDDLKLSIVDLLCKDKYVEEVEIYVEEDDIHEK